jgi:hypothetical protein
LPASIWTSRGYLADSTESKTPRGDATKALEVIQPGKHLVRVSAPEYITEEREIVAIEKALVPLEISLRV